MIPVCEKCGSKLVPCDCIEIKLSDSKPAESPIELAFAKVRELEMLILTFNTRIEDLENLLFKMGAMEKSPCFCCGYNGPGYYQPNIHKCAERHHKLCKE